MDMTSGVIFRDRNGEVIHFLDEAEEKVRRVVEEFVKEIESKIVETCLITYDTDFIITL
jgi:hypothetical protein